MGAAPVGPSEVGELDEVVGQQSWYPNLRIVKKMFGPLTLSRCFSKKKSWIWSRLRFQGLSIPDLWDDWGRTQIIISHQGWRWHGPCFNTSGNPMARPMKLAKPWVAEWLDFLLWTQRIMWYSVKYPNGCDYSFCPIWSCYCWSWFLLLPILLVKTLVSLLVELVNLPIFPLTPLFLLNSQAIRSRSLLATLDLGSTADLRSTPARSTSTSRHQWPMPLGHGDTEDMDGGDWGETRFMGGAPQLLWV